MLFDVLEVAESCWKVAESGWEVAENGTRGTKNGTRGTRNSTQTAPVVPLMAPVAPGIASVAPKGTATGARIARILHERGGLCFCGNSVSGEISYTDPYMKFPQNHCFPGFPISRNPGRARPKSPKCWHSGAILGKNSYPSALNIPHMVSVPPLTPRPSGTPGRPAAAARC